MQVTPWSWRPLAIIASLAAIAVAPQPAAAQAEAWPERPITIVVPYPAGANTDAMGRLAAAILTRELPAQVVVENRAGAGGSIGAEHVARARPDGYTFLFSGAGTQIINKALYRELRYDPETDFDSVGMFSSTPNAIAAHSSLDVDTIDELVELSKMKDGGLSYGSGGNGTLPHLTGEMFRQASGANLVHVPYKGSAPALNDLLGGQIDLVVDNLPNLVQHALAGSIKILAVTSEQRSPQLPDVPTLAELDGYEGFLSTAWLGLFAPQGTPPDIIERTNSALRKGLENPEFNQQILRAGSTLEARTAKETTEFIENERPRWVKAVSESGSQVD